MTEQIKQKTLFEISKKTLTTLENLINEGTIDIPIKFSDMLDISVGALFESEVMDRINIIDVIVEEPDLLYDIIEFEETGKYNLHDIISQIVCFRLIILMQEYLNHIGVQYQLDKEDKLESEKNNN